MGQRVVHEVVTASDGEETTVCILFSNSSHPSQEPAVVFQEAAEAASGPTAFLEALMSLRYDSKGGNQREGDRLFWISESPYGDHDLVQRATWDGIDCVVTAHPREPDQVPATIPSMR